MRSNCPRCNEPVFEFSEVCQICGYELDGIRFNNYANRPNNEELKRLSEKGLTSCIISFIKKSNEFTFLNVEKFEALELIGFYLQTPNEFFVFKTYNHPNLRSLRQHIVLDLKNFDHFVTDNRVKIYYLRDEMDVFDIAELKTYNFNKG